MLKKSPFYSVHLKKQAIRQLVRLSHAAVNEQVIRKGGRGAICITFVAVDISLYYPTVVNHVFFFSGKHD